MTVVVHVLREAAEATTSIVGFHGWAGDHAATFGRLAAVLPEGVGLVAPDLPGYGESPPPEEWTMEALQNALAPLGAALPPTPRVAVASCSGCLLALDFVLRHPGSFERMVLIEPFAWMPWYFRIFLIPVFGRIAYWTAFDNPLGRWLANRALRDKRGQLAGEQVDLTSNFRRHQPSVTLGYLRVLRSLEGPERYRSIETPTVLVAGTQSFRALKEGLSHWTASLRNAQVVMLEGAGHVPLEECPERVVSMALEGDRGEELTEPASRAVVASRRDGVC